MKRAAAVLAAAVVLAGSAVGTTSASAAAGSDATRPYLVVLRQAPVASYQGGIAGYQRTAPEAGRRFANDSAEAAAYRAYLATRQDDLLAAAGSPTELYSYTTALNGFAAMLTPTQVWTLESAPDVLLVQPDRIDPVAAIATTRPLLRPARTPARPAGSPTTDFSAIKTAALWRQVGGPENAGRGIVVGVVDTGAWPENPSLAGTPVSASTLAETYPGFSGRCQTGVRWSSATCNSKVVAAQYFVQGFGRADVARSDYLSPRDGNGHGTSVSSVAVGNAGVDTRVGSQELGVISGLAPAAGLSVYKACWAAPNPARDGCDLADTVKAVDQAVADGVDVLNVSISDPATSLADSLQLAFFNAAVANVFVAAPAGNQGPLPGTVQQPAPWVTTVGANTDEVFQGGVLLGNGRLFVGAMLSNRSVGRSPLVFAGAAPAVGVLPRRASRCYPGSLDAQRVHGAIVICDRGVTSRVSKSAAVAQAGGRAMVLVNTDPGTLDPDLHRVPTVHLGVPAGEHVTAYAARAGASATASILANATDDPAVPVMADFSGRGPSEALGGDVLKPDLSAPGVSVITAIAPTADDEQFSDVVSGTSVAAPHAAGVAAVVRAAHPTWTPAAVKSAMLTTALPLRGSPTPFSRGAGEIDASRVLHPELVYDTGLDQWVALLRSEGLDLVGYGLDRSADPLADAPADTLGTASEVNAASIAVGDLVGRVSVGRSVTNTGSEASTFSAAVSGLRGIGVSVSPRTITLAAGESSSFRVSFTATRQARYGVFATGSLTWRAASGASIVSPVVVRPELAEIPTTVTSSVRTGSLTVTGRAGVTGTLRVAGSGLVGALPESFVLVPGPFDPAHPASSTATVERIVTIAPGSRAAHFEATSGDAGDDLDLSLYRGDTLVRAATTSGPNQTLTWPRPEAGTYRLFVTARRAGDATAVHVSVTSWVLPHRGIGNLQVQPRAIGVTGGDRFSVNASWSNLDSALRWWGYLAVRGLPGSTSVTLG